MKKRADSVLFVLFAVATAGCGAGTPRTLQSVTATPMVADAKNFPNGQVQFTASAIYNKPPTPVTPFQVTAWEALPQSIATITNSGMAQCVPGQSGTVTIRVAVPGDAPLMAVATLTCP